MLHHHLIAKDLPDGNGSQPEVISPSQTLGLEASERAGLEGEQDLVTSSDMAGRKDLKKELTGMSISTLKSARVPSAAYGALQGSPIPSVRKLVLHETDQSVIILGQVTSYYQKQMAQEAVKPALGRRKLLNRVQVVPSHQAVSLH